jgi:hypothetical protein
MAFQIVQIVYWLALSTWFGGVLFVAVAAPIVFRTVRESNPVLPGVLSVNLEGQHGTLLAGSIVGNILDRLTRVQLICGVVLLLMLIAQPFVIDLRGQNMTAAILRSAMFLVAVALVVYDWRVVWPKIQKHREEYIDHADEPEVANPAKDQFDRYHRQSVSIMMVVLFLLLGMILFSANITPRGRGEIIPPTAMLPQSLPEATTA